MFEKVTEENLRAVVDALSGIYAAKESELKLAQFARTIALYARCELARRERESEAG